MPKILKYRQIKLHEANAHYIVYVKSDEESTFELHVEVEAGSGQTLTQVVAHYLDDTNIELVKIENT